jgi:hypothetical protein
MFLFSVVIAFVSGKPGDHAKCMLLFFQVSDRLALTLGGSKEPGNCNSTVECAACLDLRWTRDLLFCNEFNPAKAMLVRVVAMLTKRLERFDPEQSRWSERRKIAKINFSAIRVFKPYQSFLLTSRPLC